MESQQQQVDSPKGCHKGGSPLSIEEVSEARRVLVEQYMARYFESQKYVRKLERALEKIEEHTCGYCTDVARGCLAK